MGFKRNAPTLALTFEGELSGLQVDTRTVGRKQYRQLAELHEQFSGERPQGADAWNAFDSLCEAFARVLVAWNLEDDNGPIEPTSEALDDQGIEFTLALVIGWLQAVDVYTAQLTSDTTQHLQGDNESWSSNPSMDFDESQIPMS